MPAQQHFDDTATVGELIAVLEEIREEYGEDVEVMTHHEEGYYRAISPTFTPPVEWDPYDDGDLVL